MSKLEVVFGLGLAHSLLIMDNTSRTATALFPDTGNTVHLSIFENFEWPEEGYGAFDMVLLRVERECNPEDREEAQSYAALKKWGVIGDAATALGRVLSYIRDEDFMRTQAVAGYPAVVSESPHSNPAVQVARADVFFDGKAVTILPLTGVPSIPVERGVWDRVCERLERGEDVPAYRGFLLDAYYFATSGDPVRAVVMACAAWEIALRQFLSSKGTKDPGRANLLKLRELAEQVKGKLLFDSHDVETRTALIDALVRLPQLRNKLLHQGRKDLEREDVVGVTVAVD